MIYIAFEIIDKQQFTICTYITLNFLYRKRDRSLKKSKTIACLKKSQVLQKSKIKRTDLLKFQNKIGQKSCSIKNVNVQKSATKYLK